jgi:hypothetical protein
MNPVATVLVLICLLCVFLFVVATNKFLKFKRLESRLKTKQKEFSVIDFIEMFRKSTYINEYEIVMVRMYAISVLFDIGIRKVFSVCIKMYLAKTTLTKSKKVDFINLTDFLLKYLLLGYGINHIQSTYLYNYQVVFEKDLNSSQKLKQDQYFFLVDLIEKNLSIQIIEKAVS